MPEFDRNLNPILLNTDQALPQLDNPASDLNAGPAEYSLGGKPLSARDRLFGNGPIIRSMAPTVSAKELYENRRYATYSPDIVDIEDQKAYAQSGWNKAANGLLKGLNLTATTVAGGFGMLYGLAKSPFSGRLSDIFDNEVMRGLDNWNNKVDQEYLPNYYTNVEKNAKWYSTDNWLKTNFLFDKLIKNAGFAVGAMVGGNIANAGFKTAGAFVGELAMGAAEASQGFKLFTPLLRNTARAFSVGKNVETAAVLESEIASIADLTAKASRIGKIAEEANFFARINDVGRRTAVAAYSSAGEASFEALQTATQLRENLINKYKLESGGEEPFGEALEEINRKAESAGKAAFFGNLALLSVTEFTQLPYLVGSSYRADKMAANNFISRADDIALKEGKFVAKEATSNFAKIWDKARIGRYVFDPKEAGQELGQYALQVGTQNYYDKAYQGQDAQAWVDGFLYGFVGKDETGEGVGALVSKEGMESLVLGGLTGGLMQAVGQFKESRALSRNTQALLNNLNDAPTFKQAFKERLDAVNRGVVLQQQRQDAIVNDQELEAKDLKADMLHNYLAPRIKYGRFDLVMDDIQDLKRQGLTEGGLSSLKEQGLANINDTIDGYQQKLSQIESVAKNTNELYSSLNLRYAGVMNPDGTKKYPSQLIDKMIYAATKIADYDVRIPQLSSELSEYGVSTAEILNDVIIGGKPKQESLDKATEEIFKLQSIDYDDVVHKLDDVIELSYRRKLFLNEFNEMKTNPDKYIDKEVSETPTGEQKETVSVKTKDGDEELEVGQEYFLGRVIEYDKNGKEVYRFPKLTILGENEDGTIKIKDSNGKVRDVSKDVLASYKLGRVSDTLNNKKAKFYMEHANTIYEFNFGKGKKVKGRLEYAHKEGVLNFVYKNTKGEISRIEVTGDQFVPRKGFDQAMITPVGQLTAIQKAALDQFTAEKDKRYEAKRAVRLKILNDLFDDVSSQLDEVQNKLANRRAELEKVTEELAELEKKIAAGELTKKNTFKSATNKAIKAANKLSRLREDLRLEIESLQAERDTLEFNLSYVSDMAQNIDELPTDSEEFLSELKTQVNDLESLLLQNGNIINDTAKLMSKVDKALKDAVDFAFDLINKFEAKYPNLPIAPVALRQFLNKDMEFKGAWPDYQSYLQANPNLLNDLMEFDRELAEIDELDVIPNERTLKELGESIDSVQKDIAEIEKELRAKRAILDKFEDVAKAFKAQVAEENKLARNKALIEQAIGTAYQGVQLIPFDTKFEADAKKADEIIWRATSGVMRGKPHQIRANTFGFNLNRFPNRKDIRGVYVTSKNEDQILPGLTDRLRIDEAGQINEDINKDEIIAMVMVQENPDGTIVLVGEDGQPIPDGVNQLDAAIYQVFPDGDLKWGAEFNNNSMFRDAKNPDRKELIESVTKQYKEWRTSVLENPSLSERHEIDASFGLIEEVKDADGKTIYETRTPVENANLITADDLEVEQLINIPTLPSEGEDIAVVNQGTVTYRTPVGTVFLELPNGVVKLQNRKHTRQEAETIFQAILQQAKYMMDPKVGLDDPKSDRLFNWLRSVTYWGIPRDQQENRKEAGYNSIFWEVDEDTDKFMLSISGKGKDFIFTPTNLEQNRDVIVELISNLYNNVNNSMTKQLNEPYEEILSIDENGEVTSRIWKNYQSYLLSNRTPDGKTRTGEDIPLTTLMRPVAGPEDVNRTNIYFYTTDTADNFVIPVVEKKKKVAPKTLIPGAPKPKAKAKREEEEDVFRPGDEEEETGYVLDGKTVNTYVSPKSGNRIKFKATTAASPTNLDAITVVTGGEDNDIQEIIETIKKAGKDPKTEILNQLYKAIAPQIEQELQEESDEETFTVSGDAVEEFEKQTGSKPSKSIMDVLNKEIKGLNDKAMRLAIEKELKAFQPENWNQVETWLKANFPNIPVFRVKNIIQATNGRQAWGMFKDGAIYIYENAEVGTVYHEVFHAVWRMFTDGKEQKAILDEMRSRSGKFFDRASLNDISYKEATDEQLEEKLAEEFRDYVQFKKIPAKPEKGRPFILKLFADLVTMIKEFFLGPQSATKVEDMFKKIGQGYYKSHIPFQTSLSMAKEGIIDIEDAFADSDAALSLAGITDKERADIINHMTYLTILDLIKTDKGLFNIEKRSKKEVYAKLKEQILQTVGHKLQALERLVDKKIVTREQATPMNVSIMQLMQSIDTQWDVITERHEEFLKAYSIEFDENDNINLRGEDNSGRETYQDATKIDNFKKANSAVKLLLATIPVVDNEGNIEPSSIGGAKLLPSSKTYISLMNNLHTSGSVEEMLDRLRNMAVSDPNYRTLYERITKRPWIEGGVDLSKINTQHGLQLLSAFWGTFKKQAPEVKNVFILENGDIVVGEANLSTAAQQLRSEYVNSIVLKARSGEGYFTYDERRKIFKGDPKKVAGLELDKFPKMVNFLNKMGVPFTMSDVNKMSNSQRKAFREATIGIRESISNTEEIATFSGKVLDINKRLLTLGLLKSAVDNPEFSSTFFNVSGERTQTYIGTNAVSDLSEFLSKLEKFNKETVGGTQYSYLLTDSFAKGSNLMSRIFSSAGTRKKDTEDLFKVGYVSGMVNEKNGKRKESSRLTYRDRLIQELNLNLAGWYLNLVPGDASIEHMIKMGNAVSLESINRGMLEVNQIFKEYFMSELALVRENRPVAKDRNAKEMRFFLGILGKELHDTILKDSQSVEKVYERFADRINSKLESFIKKDVTKLEKTLELYGILTMGERGYNFVNVGISQELNEKQKDNHLTMLSVNYMIANIEMHKLLYSDPYQYEDELKRIKSFNSPRQAIINNSPKMNAALDRVWNRGYKSDDIGFTKFGQDYFRSATHTDVIGIADLPGYEGYKETDGSGIIGLKALRQFRIRAGNWNDNEELQYKYDIAWEKNDKGIPLTKEEQAIYNAGNPQVKSVYTPIKPIVSGTRLDKNGLPSSYNNVVLDKFALYPLSYRIMKEINKDSNAVKLYNKMQKEDIDYVVFKSGRKVGGENPHQTYVDGEFNNNPYKTETVINVPFSIMSIQSEVPSKDDNLVTRGSQITKLITLDFMEAGVPVDFMEDSDDFTARYQAWYKITDDEQHKKQSPLYREIKENQNLLQALTEWGYKNTLTKLGIKETTYKDPNGIIRKKFEIVDRNKAVQTLRDEIFKREVNDNISDALAGFLQGKVVLEATPAYQQVRNIIYSIADKQFISPKINGGMKVQIPSTFLESGVRNVKDGLYESDVLKFYEKDGKNIAEVMLGRWFDSPLSDDELLDYLNNTEEGQKILAGVGFRIPTQKQNSVDAIVIKKFLPKEFGDSVIVPAALVQKVGSDFDIDKLSVYLKNVYIKDGKPQLIPYFGIGDEAVQKFTELYDKGEFLNDKDRQELERYIEEAKVSAEDIAETSILGKKLLEATGKLFSEQEITESFTKGIPAREQIINQLYKKSLENAYIQSMENLITHPKNYDSLIKPNSVEDLKKLANEIAEKTIGESFDYKNVDNMLDRTFMSRLRHAFVTGKYAIGIAAVNNTNHSLNQRQPIYIDKGRLNLLSEEDRRWIGNADVKFKKYNKIEMDGQMVATLSMIKNADGKPISDILGKMIDGYVDISKGPWIMELGATPNVASTWMFLIKLGVPMNTVAYFMNQPMIRDYLRTIDSAGYSWLFIDDFIDSMASAYSIDISEADLKQRLARFTIPAENTLKNNVGKRPSQMSPQDKMDQYLMLNEFLKYAKMAEQLFLVTQGSNYDTSTFNDPYLVFKKQMQQIKAQQTIINSVDTLLSNSFIGDQAKTIGDVREAFAEILPSDQKNIRNIIHKVLMPYIDKNDRDFVKIAQKAVNDLFDWAVQTDQNLNKMIKDILVDDGGVSKEAIVFANKVKSDPDHPLYDNQVINIINSIPSKRAEGGANNIKLEMGDTRVYDQNNVIYAFRELRDYLKGENDPLYERIKTLAVLQSGLSSSPISFTSLLPHEDFEDIYNKTLVKINSMSNLDSFYELAVFQRNNWNNDDIVPHMRAKRIKKQDGRSFYNPSMKFLKEPVKQAVLDNEIPPIMTVSLFNRESNSDYIVYTWEKELELLTPQEIKNNKPYAQQKLIDERKAQMRKVGDFSYIVKGLFTKVYDDYGKAITTEDKKGKSYFVYKAINAWGDSFRANEFWDVDHQSQLENGFVKVEDVDNNVIISKFLEEAKPKAAPAQVAVVGEIDFQEEPSTGYKNRTIKNASADATIALAYDFDTAGERLTKSSVTAQKKQYIAVKVPSKDKSTSDLSPTTGAVTFIVEMLNEVKAKSLNIAGNGLYTMRNAKYTQEDIDTMTYKLLKAVIEDPRLKTKITSIRTGGQTGFDEAGAKAAIKLGIPTTILAPKGWAFRNKEGVDISNEQQFKARFANIKESKIKPKGKPSIDNRNQNNC